MSQVVAISDCYQSITEAHNKSLKNYKELGKNCQIEIESILKNLGFNLTNPWIATGDILGYIELNEDSTCTIAYNRRLASKDPRKSFTLAHELGHYVLHYDLLRKLLSIEDDFKGSLYRKVYRKAEINLLEMEQAKTILETENERIERQANEYASQVLIPEWYFKEQKLQIPLEYSVSDKKMLAEKTSKLFKVSKDTASIRFFGIKYEQLQ